MKNKNIFILCGVALIIILGFSVSKTALTNAVSENTTSTIQSESQSKFEKSSTALTQVITELTSKMFTTEALSVNNETTLRITEKKTEKEDITTIENTKQAKPTSPVFPIQIPTIKIPGIIPLTTASQTKSSDPKDLSCFDNSVFIGNSRLISFKNYGLAKNVYSVVGLNVDTVFTKSVSGSNVTVINELNGKDYEKVILMFGDNECGWPNQNIFIQRYSKVIAAVKEKIPNAKIYLHSVLPVSAETSAKNEFGCNNETINSLNQKIKQLAADEGVEFIEQPSCLKDADGALLPEAASDGIHLNKKYSEIWLNYLAETII
ncbi:MAG: hypothetical protein IJE19_03555 [Clostridia bacterium]|nr:hypothetical protein [Clostridia bacterium]